MLSVEVCLLSDGHRVSLEELADLVAHKVIGRVKQELKDQMAQQPHTVQFSEAQVVSVPDAAKLLGLSRSTLWKYIQEKRVKTVRLGPRITRIRMETINQVVRDGIPKRLRGREPK